MNVTKTFLSFFSIQADNEISVEDRIAKYGCGGNAEDVEEDVEESETEEVEDEGKICVLFWWYTCYLMFYN
jgi:hypothetical protein